MARKCRSDRIASSGLPSSYTSPGTLFFKKGSLLQGLGFRIKDVGFGVWVLGFGVKDLAVEDFWFRVWDSAFRVWASAPRRLQRFLPRTPCWASVGMGSIFVASSLCALVLLFTVRRYPKP